MDVWIFALWPCFVLRVIVPYSAGYFGWRWWLCCCFEGDCLLVLIASDCGCLLLLIVLGGYSLFRFIHIVGFGCF